MGSGLCVSAGSDPGLPLDHFLCGVGISSSHTTVEHHCYSTALRICCLSFHTIIAQVIRCHLHHVRPFICNNWGILLYNFLSDLRSSWSMDRFKDNAGNFPQYDLYPPPQSRRMLGHESFLPKVIRLHEKYVL